MSVLKQRAPLFCLPSGPARDRSRARSKSGRRSAEGSKDPPRRDPLPQQWRKRNSSVAVSDIYTKALLQIFAQHVVTSASVLRHEGSGAATSALRALPRRVGQSRLPSPQSSQVSIDNYTARPVRAVTPGSRQRDSTRLLPFIRRSWFSLFLLDRPLLPRPLQASP